MQIVVGIDRSAPSRAALDWSIDRAAATQMNLVILHVVDHQLDRHSSEFTAAALHEADEFLVGEAAYAASRGARVSVDLMRGEPFQALVQASATAEILVIGTHKTGFLQGRSLGSRFIGLAARSLCPVAFIPSVSLVSRRGVAVALDDSPTGRRAAIFAAAEAERLGQRLIAMYGEPWHEDPAESAQATKQRELVSAGRIDSLVASQLGTIAQTYPALHPRTMTSRRPLSLEAIDASLTAALVVICHSQAGSIGSAAETFVHDVVMNLGGPVVVIPRVPADISAD